MLSARRLVRAAVGLVIWVGVVVGLGWGGVAVAQSGGDGEQGVEQPSGREVEGGAGASLESRLGEIYGQIEGLEQVEVEVESGVVTLSGEVDDAMARETAESIATKLEETLYVENRIGMSTEVTERVSPALERAWEKAKEFVGYLPLLVVALAVLVLFWFVARWISRISFRGGAFADRPFVENLVRQFISLVVFLVGVLFVLDMFGVTTLVGAVLGTAGVAGLALGFAFRDIAENYLASIILGVQQPFGKNDHIKVGEYEGKVIRMTTRETVLMTLSGNHVRIPNSTVFKNPTYNLTRNPMRRFEFTVGVGVGEEIADAREVGVQTLRETAGVSDDPEPFMRVEELADSTVTVKLFGWVDQSQYDWLKVKSEAIRRVKSAFDAADIEMPEPTYRVLTRQFEEEDVDERRKRGEHELQDSETEVERTEEIDEQIDHDRAQSQETDLLEE